MIIDCHYCNNACCATNEGVCDCYNDDGYFDHHIEDAKTEAENCQFFEFSDAFPKF